MSKLENPYGRRFYRILAQLIAFIFRILRYHISKTVFIFINTDEKTHNNLKLSTIVIYAPVPTIDVAEYVKKLREFFEKYGYEFKQDEICYIVLRQVGTTINVPKDKEIIEYKKRKNMRIWIEIYRFALPDIEFIRFINNRLDRTPMHPLALIQIS